MNVRRVIITGATALALVAGGTAAGAAIASGPVSSSGVIDGCYTNAEVNGSHVFVLQDQGTACPKGTTAVSWNQTGPVGPTGATGPTGPAGPAGATGPAGPAGPAGPTGPAGANGTNGTNGNTILNGTGAPASSLGNNGDFYIDTAADVLYGPKAGGTWPSTGVSLVGPQGPAGPTGPQGPAGSAGSYACTTDGGAPGTVQVSYTTGSNNAVTFTYACVAPTTDANCTHSDGLGDNYTDCNDLLGTPGDASTYNATMAADAASAWNGGNPLPAGDVEYGPGQNPQSCGTAEEIDIANVSTSQYVESIWWFYTGSLAGTVEVLNTQTTGSICSPVNPVTISTWN